MGDVIRAVDLEDNSDAILIPEGTIDPSLDKEDNKEIKIEEEPSKDANPDDNKSEPEDKSKESPDEDKKDLKTISDEELEAMSDDELDELLASMEVDQEKKTEEIDDKSSEKEIDMALKEKDALLKAVSDRLESKIRENADLKVQLAEKNIFGGKGEGGESMMVFHTNLSKAQEGDEAAKEQVMKFLDKTRKEIFGKSFGEDDIDKNTDLISNSNGIKSEMKPSSLSDEDMKEAIRVL